MNIVEWWPKLTPTTRALLKENNGDVVPVAVIAEIMDAGGSVASYDWWIAGQGSSEFYLTDELTDWIEAVANGENPAAR